MTTATEALHFEGFSLLPRERCLLVDGTPAKIGARAFDLLMILLAERERVLSKEELLERVWPGLVVEENNLTVHVSQLRRLCGTRVVSTVPGRGYQFTARNIGAQPGAARPREPQSDRVALSRGNLPARLPDLIGRELERAELHQMLQVQRWVTLTGAGGVGKTRLAEAVCQDAANGLCCWIVELASISDPHLVANAIAQAMGISIFDSSRPLQAIVTALQGEPVLLMLDNCEHLLGEVSMLCRALLRELPLLRVLCTSQELLRGQEETVYKLGPLRLPAPDDARAEDAGAVQLLQARIRALQRNFEITPAAMVDAVVICRQLDGLPLAIELAAGRVPLLGLSGVRERLGELFRLLTGDARVRLRRHQTLRAALDWSYQLLQPAEQALLRRLGVFSGTFCAEGVRQITEDMGASEWDALDALGSLIDKSLVQVREQEPPRYLLLETTRAYALEQLAARGETHEALARHAQATSLVCQLAVRRRDTTAIWNEAANIRAAFDWALRDGDATLAVSLVNDSSVVLALGGLVGEVVQRLVQVEPLVTQELPIRLAARYWQWLGRFGNDGRLPGRRCVAALERAEQLYRELRHDRQVHACLRMRAEALVELGELAAAGQALNEALTLEAAECPMADRMRRLRIEAKLLIARGEFDRAVTRLDEALAMASRGDVHRYVATLTQDVGQCLLHAGNALGAEVRFRSVLDDPRQNLAASLAKAYACMGLATALLMQGRVAHARPAAVDAVSKLCDCGILQAHAEAFAWLLAALGNDRAAAGLLSTADAFRAASQIIRGPVQRHAYAQAQALLAARGATVDDRNGDPVLSGGELAQLLISALA